MFGFFAAIQQFLAVDGSKIVFLGQFSPTSCILLKAGSVFGGQSPPAQEARDLAFTSQSATKNHVTLGCSFPFPQLLLKLL